MYAYFKGKIVEITEDNLILEVNQIGYNIKISAGMAASLPGIGSDIKVYTYTSVKEDALQLYGFLTKDDLDMFRQMITVNGIGPKGALGILSIMDADTIRFAILSGDAKTIAKAPGIGAKTAERLIIDLKDRVKLEDTYVGGQIEGPKSSTQETPQKKEAVEALVALGYSGSDAIQAIAKAGVLEDADTETILKAALKQMAFI